MSERAPSTRTMKISEVKSTLSSLVNEVYRRETRVLIEKSGIPVAALISVDDLNRLTRLDQEDHEAWAVVEAMREPFRDVPPEEIEREVAKAVAEVRSEMRAKRDWDAGTAAFEAFGAAFADQSVEEIEAQIDRIMREGPEVEEPKHTRQSA
jgi:prevent-host-death family protein